MKRLRGNIIALSVFTAALGSIVYGLLANLIPSDWTTQFWYRSIVVLLVLVVSYAIYHVARRLANLQKPEDKNREDLLATVRGKWITSYLENYGHTFYSEKLIPVNLRKQAVGQFTTHIERPNENAAEPFLPDATTPLSPITQIYDAAQHRLLIFGELGSGKTTQLLKLLMELLARAEDPVGKHPIPVVFNLSSWAVKRQPLTEWLVEELNTSYAIPAEIGKNWVELNQIIPLLDGLDEVARAYLPECIQTINDCLGHLSHCVVCCRASVYLEQDQRVHIRTAAFVEPLTLLQIDDYLSDPDEHLDALREAIHADSKLQGLAKVPMNLRILALAYHEKSTSELLEILTSPTIPSEQKLCEAFVQRMLQDRSIVERYGSEQVKVGLGWLAQKLEENKLKEFYIERMQPGWLAEERSQQLYRRVAVELLPRLLIGLVSGLYIGLLLGSIEIGLLGGVTFGLLSIVEEVKRVHGSIWSWESWQRSIVRGLVFGLFFGLLLGLRSGLGTGLVFGIEQGVLFGPFIGLIRRNEIDSELISDSKRLKTNWRLRVGRGLISISRGIVIGLIVTTVTRTFVDPLNGLFCGLFFGLLSILIRRVEVEIRPAEIVKWSWISLRWSLVRGLLEGIFFGLLYGLLVGLYFIMVVGLSNEGLLAATVFALFFILHYGGPFVLMLGLSRGLINGLSSDMLDSRSIAKPNQGIRRSAYNSVVLGSVYGLFIAVILAASLQLILPLTVLTQSRVIIYALLGGLVGGIITGFFGGGSECIKHIILRLLLWRHKHIPWNYTDFLEYVYQKRFLRKAGGGYIFWYPPLRDYFASLNTTPTPEIRARRSGR
jgi:hypothetical protein